MGLTNASVGRGAAGAGRDSLRADAGTPVVALAGNPNVGKSTVFNALTGARQHTGNWPGKTVSTARGLCAALPRPCLLVDLPGTYSLLAHSAEEEVARDFLCSGGADAAVVVCDATCLERNLNLALQVLELCPRTIVCVNLMDEAGRKGIRVDLPALSRRLGVPAVGVSAREKGGLAPLLEVLSRMDDLPARSAPVLRYPAPVEAALAEVTPAAEKFCGGHLSARWLALRLLGPEEGIPENLSAFPGAAPGALSALKKAAERVRAELGITPQALEDLVVTALVDEAESIAADAVSRRGGGYGPADRRLDRFLTGRATGYPVMLLLLAGVFWLTIVGANYPSALLSAGFSRLQDLLTALFALPGAPAWLYGPLVLGMFRVLGWVVSVMLPPMAIFFPLFTLLEDAGYLPRVAYNLDRPFQRCRACGKQALTMCMGFGCNAAGVVGCRIIDSPRERLLAILTNSFVPCNGRFPALIAVLTMFFAGTAGGAVSSLACALLLTAVILLSVGNTFGATWLLSGTLLRGIPSSFALEMPPYRPPQVGKVLVRSFLDRTLFVLGRAVCVAAPAGLLIWLAANVTVGDMSILGRCAAFLDPFARLFGLDGAILIAFLLGLPANEIVLPILLMVYTAQGTLPDTSSLLEMRQILAANGWTWVTAGSCVLFYLMHWPCATTLLTIRRETGSLRWTLLAAALPTAAGLCACFLLSRAAALCAVLASLGAG